jgi:predicted dinucleotide-binding enzyme
MKIGILGTGMVAQALAGKLVSLDHQVMIGTRDVARTLQRTEKDAFGNPPFSEWHRNISGVKLEDFSQAAAFGELVINATAGSASLAALEIAGTSHLNGKILIDVTNPLDFSQGMPPSLIVCNTDSLGEQIQRSFPDVKVVKTLNTMNAYLMVNPDQVGNGDHHIFVSGDDQAAKDEVIGYLKEWFGWKHVIDLGDITTARGTEMILPLWVRLMGTLQTPMFNFKIVK